MVKPIQKLVELTLQLKQCEVSGGLHVFFLFKLPRKWLVFHRCDYYLPGGDGWIHQPCYLLIKCLNLNTTPNLPVWLRSKPQLMDLLCSIFCLSIACPLCPASHGQGGELQLATGSVLGKVVQMLIQYLSLNTIKQTPCFHWQCSKHTQSYSAMKSCLWPKVKMLQLCSIGLILRYTRFLSKRRNWNLGMFLFSTPSW